MGGTDYLIKNSLRLITTGTPPSGSMLIYVQQYQSELHAIIIYGTDK